MTIFPDGRLRLLDEQSHPLLTYSATRHSLVHEHGHEEYGVYDSSNYSVDVWANDKLLFVFSIRRNRVVSGWFPVRSSTRLLAWSVNLIREAGFDEWVKGALESTLVSYGNSPYATPGRLRTVRRLIESCG